MKQKQTPIRHDRIAKDPQILAGKPTIKGAGISVELMTDYLEGGRTEKPIGGSLAGLDIEDWTKFVQNVHGSTDG